MNVCNHIMKIYKGDIDLNSYKTETVHYIRGEMIDITSIYQESVALRRDKNLCCCCCKTGPVSCALRLDRTGYVPGEDINLDAEIQNYSRKEVTTSYVSMQQVRTSGGGRFRSI